jgi:hypothetical protein
MDLFNTHYNVTQHQKLLLLISKLDILLLPKVVEVTITLKHTIKNMLIIQFLQKPMEVLLIGMMKES